MMLRRWAVGPSVNNSFPEHISESTCPIVFKFFTQHPWVVQLLLFYAQWGPRNYEKCKMFRLIHFIMMSLNKIRFVAQAATFGNFFY